MAFFGLTEYPRISQKLFEETFDMMFLDADTHGFGRSKRSILSDVSEETIEAIKKANSLDVQLYEYAKQLLFDRFDRLERKYPKIEATAKGGHGLRDDVVNWGEREDAVQGIKR
jgi:heparan sulfate 6-O-sulfotransferase HS6ST1